VYLIYLEIILLFNRHVADYQSFHLPGTFVVWHWARRVDTELLAFAKSWFARRNSKRCIVNWSTLPICIRRVRNNCSLSKNGGIAVVLVKDRPIKVKAVSSGKGKCSRTHPLLESCRRFSRVLGVLVHLESKHLVVVSVLVDEPKPTAVVWIGFSRAV